MINGPKHATEAAEAILDALEESHLGSEVFNAGRPTLPGVYPVVSSIVLAIGSSAVELVTVAGDPEAVPKEVSGYVIAGDIFVRFGAQTDHERGLKGDFTVEARSLRDVVAISVKGGNLFGIDAPEWPGRPGIVLRFADGDSAELPLSKHASPRERDVVARFIQRIPSLLSAHPR